MFRKAIRRGFQLMGYEIRKIDRNIVMRRGFDTYRYLNEDGSFNYKRYRATQIEGNKTKLHRVFVREADVEFLSKYLKANLGLIKFGICHGTRRGLEQKWFRAALAAEVIGTEISDTASKFKHTLQWDFHDVKDEWINKADFIYSNSLDHSYDPEMCLNAWMSCVRPGGFCILEHTSLHERATRLDPFGVRLPELLHLILRWGRGSYGIRELIPAPTLRDDARDSNFIVVERIRKD